MKNHDLPCGCYRPNAHAAIVLCDKHRPQHTVSKSARRRRRKKGEDFARSRRQLGYRKPQPVPDYDDL